MILGRTEENLWKKNSEKCERDLWFWGGYILRDEMQRAHKACAYIPVPKGTDVHSLTKKCQLWRDADFFQH